MFTADSPKGKSLPSPEGRIEVGEIAAARDSSAVSEMCVEPLIPSARLRFDLGSCKPSIAVQGFIGHRVTALRAGSGFSHSLDTGFLNLPLLGCVDMESVIRANHGIGTRTVIAKLTDASLLIVGVVIASARGLSESRNAKKADE